MSSMLLRALVVDDEVIARSMVKGALSAEGFICDVAMDGVEALDKARATRYDLIVTDLRMPNKHGHSLSVELLTDSQLPAPMIVVHSSVDDPRLTKDLIFRGVDDVVCKPTNYGVFAAKMKAMVTRRRREQPARAIAPESGRSARDAAGEKSSRAATRTLIGIEEFDRRLAQMSHILPVSSVAVDVLKRIQSDDFDVRLLAGVLKRDAVLAAELLRLANSPIYNPRGNRIVDLQDAVALVGAKRLGEISLAISALGAVTSTVIPWFDRELAWQRSLAAGMTANRIMEKLGTSSRSHGIVFSALMYPLGRVILGTVYPEVYQGLIEDCERESQSLLRLERDVFPRTPAAAAAQLLSCWDLPVEVCVPLIHADAPLASLSLLPGPVRTSVTILKAALLISEFAVGRWMPWDNIEFPTRALLDELCIDSAEEMIATVRNDLRSHGVNVTAARKTSTSASLIASRDAKVLRLCNPTHGSSDFIRPLLTSMDFQLRDVPWGDTGPCDNTLVSFLDAADVSALSYLENVGQQKIVWLVDSTVPELHTDPHHLIRLPSSYSAIRAACDKVAVNATANSPEAAAEASLPALTGSQIQREPAAVAI